MNTIHKQRLIIFFSFFRETRAYLDDIFKQGEEVSVNVFEDHFCNFGKALERLEVFEGPIDSLTGSGDRSIFTGRIVNLWPKVKI